MSLCSSAAIEWNIMALTARVTVVHLGLPAYHISSLTLYIFYACQGMMTNTSNLWSALPGTKLLGTVAEIQDFFNFNALIDCRAARDHKIS
jgi:hypothetical protein